MIAEIFYPKEMKNHISTLRADGDLNEYSLQQYNKQIYIALIIIALALWLCLGIHPIIYFLLCLTLPTGFYFYSRWFYATHMRPYLKGEKATGIVSNYTFYRHHAQCHFEVNGTKYKMPKIMLWNNKASRPEVGQKIQIYLSADRNGYAMPNISPFTKLFCLQKSKIST